MNLEVEATYEDGVLKVGRDLPLQNGERVKVTIQRPGGRARASAGIFAWRGSREDLETLLGPDNHPWALDK